MIRDTMTRPSAVGGHIGRAGFTLVELLVVISILMLLVGLLVPSIHRFRVLAKRGQSMGTISLLDTACNLYRDDHGEFPDSTPAAIGGFAMEGRHRLVECLVGYLPLAADGADGNGFRVPGGKKLYGPYNGAEKVKSMQDAGVTPSVPVFIDSFGNPIYYYKFNGTQYQSADNTGLGAPPVGPETSLNYATYQGATTPKYFQKSFLLMSAGADGVFTPYNSASTTDDVTNFLRGLPGQ